MEVKAKLKIAGLIIQIQSVFPLAEMTEKQKLEEYGRLFDNFLYRGQKRPDIAIELRFAGRLPELISGRNTFISSYYLKKEENWRITRRKDQYIYQCSLKDEESMARVSKDFSRAVFYRLPGKSQSKAWKLTDITHNFLQVLMIDYLALRGLGVLAHGVGIHDRDHQGLLFCGRSGAGKSTSARIWSGHSRAMVLNDDRVIVRRVNKRFFIYSCPWPGEFSDNFKLRLKPAPLKKLFFIYHAKNNIAVRIGQARAFGLLYPATFPVFWDRKCLENIAGFCHILVQSVPCYRLGFRKNKNVIGFVRGIDRKNKNAGTSV